MFKSHKKMNCPDDSVLTVTGAGQKLVKLAKSPLLFCFRKIRAMSFGIKIPSIQTPVVIRGRIGYLAFFSCVMFVIMVAFASTWRAFYPAEFAVLSVVGTTLLFSGVLFHEVAWGWDTSSLFPWRKRDMIFTFKQSALPSTQWKVLMFCVCFLVVTLSQIAMKLYFGTIPKVISLVPSSIYPAVSYYVGIAIAEEFFFAGLLFCTWLLMTRHVGVSMFVNALIFSAFHSAMYYVLHVGDPAFIPAMFAARLSLDLFGYYLTGGDIWVGVFAHSFGNVLPSLLVQ